MGAGLTLTAETTEWWHLYAAFSGLTAIGISLAGWVPAVILIHGWFRIGSQRPWASRRPASARDPGVGIRWPSSRLIHGLAVGLSNGSALDRGMVAAATRWLMRDPPGLTTSTADRTGGDVGTTWTLATAARTWRFWGVAGVYFTGNFATQMLMVHQVAYLVDHGVPPWLPPPSAAPSAWSASAARWGGECSRIAQGASWRARWHSAVWRPASARWSWRAGIRRR